MALVGTQTLACDVGAPITHTYQLDPANTTTGLCLNFRNDSGFACIARVLYYVKTAATGGTYTLDFGVTTTSAAQATTMQDGATATATTCAFATNIVPIADGSYLTAYTVDSSTPALATGLVAYAIIQLWPVNPVIVA
jgi:hypothetical protein